MALRIASQAYLSQGVNPFDLKGRLSVDLKTFYSRIKDIRSADLGDLWELARDLVVSLDQWGKQIGQRTGEKKMEIALDVSWGFIEERGGTAALRDRIASHLPLPDFIERRLLGFFFNEARAKKLIRFVLELAVREVRKFRD